MQPKNSTPIDPNDLLAVTRAYGDGMQTAHDSGQSDLEDLRYEGVKAVARAVCPDGYVVTSVADLNEMLLLMGWYLGPQDSDLYKRLHSLIPEQEATR